MKAMISIIMNHLCKQSLVALFLLSLCIDSLGQSFEELAKFLPTTTTVNGCFGSRVAISGDTAIVGAFGDGSTINEGAVYIYTYSGSTWSKTAKLKEPTPGSNHYFGKSVAISGNRIIVGANTSDGKGVAYVFEFSGGSWSAGTALTASDAESNDVFGQSVGISGNIAIVGAFLESPSDEGAAYIFTYSGSTWSQTTKLTASDIGSGDQFGYSVAISGDTAIVGAWSNDIGSNGNQGSAYIFKYNGSVWYQDAILLASDGALADEFGRSVAISGENAIVGAYGDDDLGSYSGSAYIFNNSSGSVWGQTKLVASDGEAWDVYGWSVDISGDKAIVAASGSDEVGNSGGLAYTYEYNGASWIEGDKLGGSDPTTYNYISVSAAISGNNALVGFWGDLYEDGSGLGSVSIFKDSGSSWSESMLAATEAATDDEFGQSVAISGDIAIVGSMRDDENGVDSGSAYTYEYNGSAWLETAKLVASDGADGDRFGVSVAISGNKAIVGAYNDDSNTGSAYIFELSGGVWTEVTKLTASDGSTGDLYGWSVGISGDQAIVGALTNDNPIDKEGSAYIYDGTDNWSETKLTVLDAAPGDYFGVSVSISENLAVVGAYWDDDNGSKSGSAYIFDGTAGWSELKKLVASDGEANDNFGIAVAISGDTVLIGAYNDNGSTSFEGSAYVYGYDGISTWTETKLVASDAMTNAQFGNSVAISGEEAIVGAWAHDGGTFTEGSAHSFEIQGGVWKESSKLVSSDAAPGDYFGVSVSISDGNALIGAYKDDGGSSDEGSVYIFERILPLPVEFIGFSAIPKENKYVSLDWTTATEVNNDYFTVEKSTDGTSWEIVKTIDGAGNTSTLLSYSTTDEYPYYGLSYYRLKQTDFDGQFSYSKVLTVEIETTNSTFIYPNPAVNRLTLTGDETIIKDITIFNLAGLDVTHLAKFEEQGKARVIIDISNMGKGLYFIQTKTTINKLYLQ